MQTNAGEGNRVVLVGGVPVPDKMKSIEERWGVVVEWIALERGETRPAASVAAKINSGTIGVLLILQGLLSHKAADKMVVAARAAKIPYAMADKGGIASIERALEAIGKRIP
jgi:adenosylcobinamide amidohydrolase